MKSNPNFSHLKTILLLIVCSTYVFYANSITATETSINSNLETRILVFGDSLSAAYNMPQDKGWPKLLQDLIKNKQLNIKIINASISGETTEGGLARLPKQLKQHQPNIVLIELGGNDGLRGFDLSQTRQNIAKMVELSQAHGAKVLLAGIQLPPNFGRTYTTKFYDIYQQIKETYQVSLIPFILEGVATNRELMQADGIHPNELGQPIIMQTVWQHLQPILDLNKVKSS
ncbi:arylesterase [Aliikangiella sp. IMCC44653]